MWISFSFVDVYFDNGDFISFSIFKKMEDNYGCSGYKCFHLAVWCMSSNCFFSNISTRPFYTKIWFHHCSFQIVNSFTFINMCNPRLYDCLETIIRVSDWNLKLRLVWQAWRKAMPGMFVWVSSNSFQSSAKQVINSISQ